MLIGLVTVLSRSYRLLLFLAAVGISYLALHAFLVGDLRPAVIGIDWLIKFFSIPVFVVYFLRNIKSDPSGSRVFLFAKICFFVLAANIILGTFGFGYSSYGEGEMTLGAKGYIYAGNELALALVLSGALVMQELIEKDKLGLFVGFSMVLLLLASLTAIKAGIAAVLILFLSYPCVALVSKRQGQFVPLRMLILTVLVLATAPIVLAAAIYFVLYFVGLWARVEYFVSHYGILTVLLSQRDLRAEVAIDIFLHDYSVIMQLFGSGINWLGEYRVTANVEMDPLDFLLRYGLVGVSGAYGLLGVVLVLSIREAARDARRMYSVICQVIVIGVSVFAGHVLYSAMAAPLLAAVMAVGLVGLSSTAGNQRHRLIDRTVAT